MRFEDGIFGEYKLIQGPTNVGDRLPINNDTFKARASDVDADAYLENGNPNPDYQADGLTVYNTDGDVAKAGDDCYLYPAMAGRAVKIYTNNCDKNVTVRPLGGKSDGSDDITIKLFPGMMLPIACKGIAVPNGSSVVILA